MRVLYKFLSLVLCLGSGSVSNAQTVTYVEITYNNAAVTSGKLAVAGSRTLGVKVTPEEAASLPVTWSTSDPLIASITGTKVRGMGAGNATITAEVGGVKATYVLEVVQKAAKLGQYYFDNNSWEDGGIVEGKKCIGVIYYVDPTNTMSGKIVSLDEAQRLQWSLAASSQPGATSATDGMANMEAIKDQSDWATSYAAAKWCAEKTEGGLDWYLPAIDELRQLYAASCGLVWNGFNATDNPAGLNPNWANLLQTMLPGDETNPYPTERANFNKKFTNISASALNADGTTRYWSSTQYADDFAQLLSFEGGYSQMQPKQYDHVANTRAIAAFPKASGSSLVENITGVSNRITVTPNPAVSVATVESSSEISSVRIYSLVGVLEPASVDVQGNIATINVSTLTPGTYIVVVKTANGESSATKLIKIY